MKNILSCALTVWLVLFCMQALAEPSGRALLDKARDYVASAPAIRRVDTSEQSAAVIVGQRRVEQAPQTNVVTIEINSAKQLARQTATIQGKELIMLRHGEKAAMKLGAGPWEIPRGPFGIMAKAFPNPAERPTVKVLRYSSKHWISKSDYRHLKAVQEYKVKMSFALADGTQPLIEQSSQVTSRCSYDKVTIEIPEEAKNILSSVNARL